MSFRIIVPNSVRKQLEALPSDVEDRLLQSLVELSDEPLPRGSLKLQGRDGWRIRIGDYRIIYEIHTHDRTIVVLTIGHRRELYR